jgi:hypothetical protein
VNLRIGLPERNEGGGEVLMQLADKAVATSNRATAKILCQPWIDHGSGVTTGGKNSSVAVRCFDRRPVQDENDQKQSKSTRKAGALILNPAGESAGHCLISYVKVRLVRC